MNQTTHTPSDPAAHVSRMVWQPVAAAIAAGRRVADAAAIAGVNPRTVQRWARKPAFIKYVADLRSEAISAASGALTGATDAAARRLRELLDSTDERVSLGAARSLIQLGRELRAQEEFARRLTDIEDRIAAAGSGGAANG